MTRLKKILTTTTALAALFAVGCERRDTSTANKDLPKTVDPSVPAPQPVQPTGPTGPAGAPAPAPTADTTAPAPSGSGPTMPVSGTDKVMIVYKDGQTTVLGVAEADKDKAIMLEQKLGKAGFNPGIVDGKIDSATVQAIRQFQQKKGLEVTGNIDTETASALGLDWKLDTLKKDVSGNTIDDKSEQMKKDVKGMGDEVKDKAGEMKQDIDRELNESKPQPTTPSEPAPAPAPAQP